MKLEELKPFGVKIFASKNRNKLTNIHPTDILNWMRQYKLIIFSGFNFTPKEELVAYVKTIGPLLEWEFGNVMEMKVDKDANNYLFTSSCVPFHWDGAFHKEPLYLFFQCIKAPLTNCGGETLFCNSENLYSHATLQEKQSWESLKITYSTEKLSHYGGKIQIPLIQTHPISGQPIVRFAEPVPDNYLNPVRLTIDNLDDNQTKALISLISPRLYCFDLTYTHKWEDNDYVIADNFSLLHGRNAFNAFSPRHLRRIQILQD